MTSVKSGKSHCSDDERAWQDDWKGLWLIETGLGLKKNSQAE